MARKDKTTQRDGPVKDFIASLEDEHTMKDSLVLIDMMRRTSRHRPKGWNQGTIGFDAYHYKYDNGREGDRHALGFHPGRGKMTVHPMDGTARHSALLPRLGKHTTSRVCLHVKRLDDVQLSILERILQQSYDYLKSRDGHMHRVE
jgi:hypothetical protein